MPAPIPMRPDCSSSDLRRLAARSSDVRQSRRLPALAAVADGMSRGDGARIGGMDRQTLRDRMLRFNAGGPEGLMDRPRGGSKSRLSEAQRAELAGLAGTGPDAAVDGIVRWRRSELKAVIKARFGVGYHERHVGQILHDPGFSHISARPRHPRQPAGQRYQNACLFGAICPARGTGAAIMMPTADTRAMQSHLDEISRTVATGAHAVILTDQAGRHTTAAPDIPENPVFETYDAILDAGCQAWNKLIAMPETITSIRSGDLGYRR